MTAISYFQARLLLGYIVLYIVKSDRLSAINVTARDLKLLTS